MKWNKKNLKRYEFAVRIESDLHQNLEAYDGAVGTLVKKLLEKYFEENRNND